MKPAALPETLCSLGLEVHRDTTRSAFVLYDRYEPGTIVTLNFSRARLSVLELVNDGGKHNRNYKQLRSESAKNILTYMLLPRPVDPGDRLKERTALNVVGDWATPTASCKQEGPRPPPSPLLPPADRGYGESTGQLQEDEPAQEEEAAGAAAEGAAAEDEAAAEGEVDVRCYLATPGAPSVAAAATSILPSQTCTTHLLLQLPTIQTTWNCPEPILTLQYSLPGTGIWKNYPGMKLKASSRVSVDALDPSTEHEFRLYARSDAGAAAESPPSASTGALMACVVAEPPESVPAEREIIFDIAMDWHLAIAAVTAIAAACSFGLAVCSRLMSGQLLRSAPGGRHRLVRQSLAYDFDDDDEMELPPSLPRDTSTPETKAISAAAAALFSISDDEDFEDEPIRMPEPPREVLWEEGGQSPRCGASERREV